MEVLDQPQNTSTPVMRSTTFARRMATGYEAFSSSPPSSKASIQAIVSDSKSVLSVGVKPNGRLSETRAATLLYGCDRRDWIFPSN